ncbi:hypothetical protein QAD02_005539 [Eretmocerus hayati]|uniref:Uncharacterized protein n=1 Tax=Eretmocerus hayati TaxID=131215 RepID=A0ACC2NVN0_9HYME|nr:hypothetical protein QAD02_005539 [Eretmocerus hayati]
MAFSQSSSRETQNRKILEELQLKKQMLLKHGIQQSLATPSTSAAPSPLPSTSSSSEGAKESLQRAALQNAHASSTGYFITTDSSFGNLILPVLPRFDDKQTE